MKAEKLILSVVAIIVGLIAAGIAFYLYQITKTLPPAKDQTITIKPKTTPIPTPNSENFLTVETPKNEEVFDKKTITISGKTTPKSNIIVSSVNNDQVVSPSETG